MNATLIELVVTAVLALCGSGGLGFALLHYHRDEAAQVIAQHGAILTDMKTIYEAMKDERNAAREENLRAHAENLSLRESLNSAEALIETLRDEIRGLRRELRKHTNGG